jgi:SAM-dependent methyltransferase
MYPASFFKKRDKLNFRAPYIVQAIMSTLSPKSVVDVGCAIGDLVKGFQDLKIRALGIEGSRAAAPYVVLDEMSILYEDLRLPLPPMSKFDLLISFEVFEHIEEEYADQLCKNVTELSDNLLISAAPPGQEGHHHFNCQLPEYWSAKFEKLNFSRVTSVEHRIKQLLKSQARRAGIKAIYQNLLFYRRKND